MPANDGLIIEIGLNDELLRQGAQAAQRIMQNFEKVSTAALGGVDKAIALVAERFTDIPEAATKSLENSKALFGKKFAEIRGLADKALAGIGTTGQLDLGVDQLRASAAASSQRAEAIEKISQAQFRLAQASGVVTKADFAALQASRAAQIAAEREAEALLRKAGALERVQIELGQSIAPQNALVAAQQRVVVSAGAARAGQQQLVFSVNDVAASFASGTPLLQIFGQQITQVQQAVTLLKGSSSGLLSVLGSPYVAVITAAATIIATFAFNTRDASAAQDAAKQSSDNFKARLLDIGNFADATSGKMLNLAESTLAAARAFRTLEQIKRSKEVQTLEIGGFKSLERFSEENGTGRRGAVSQNGRFAGLSILQENFDPRVEAIIKQSQGNIFKAEQLLADAVKSGQTDLAKTLGEVRLKNAQALDIARDFTKTRDELDFLTGKRSTVPGFRGGGVSGGGVGSSGGGGGRSARGGSIFAPQIAQSVDPIFEGLEDIFATITKDTRDVIRANLESISTVLEDGRDGDAFKDERKLDEFLKQRDFENRVDAEDRLRDIRANNERELSGLFIDLFEGGTKRVFANFKQIGLQAVADIAARLILGGGNSGGGGGGGLLGSLFGGGGGDGGGGLLASLFGGGRANGGDIVPGKFYLTGENGPELIAPRLPATVLNNRALSALGGGGGMSITINAPGATAETVSMIRRVLAEATPGLLNAAQNQTIRSINRPRLNGT